MDRFEEVSLDKIVWMDPIRTEISPKDISDMSKSILAGGMIHPIVVEEKEAGKYNGIVGRLRFLGHERIGKTTILCRIHSFLDDSSRKAWQLIENIVRRDLNPIAIGEGYKKFKEYCEQELGGKYDKDVIGTMKTKIQDVSGEEGPSEKTIWKYIQFAEDIPENVKAIVKTLPRETFGKRHAEQMLRLKEDSEAMLRFAEWLRDTKPTSNQLRAQINDYLKVQSQAVDVVKQAVEAEDISLKHAAAISDAYGDVQEPMLEMTKKGSLKPAQIKKVVDFTKAHEDRIPELLEKGSKDPVLALSVAEGKQVLETKEEVAMFFRGGKGLAKKEEFYCPHCNAKFVVDWEKGEILFNEEAST